MAIVLTKYGEKDNFNDQREYLLDFESDAADLPTGCSPGSTAFVIETGAVYMLNSLKEWKEI